MSHVAEVGEAAISNIKELLKENQRLHAAVKQLQFQARHCSCSEIVVVKEEENNIIDMDVYDVYGVMGENVFRCNETSLCYGSTYFIVLWSK